MKWMPNSSKRVLRICSQRATMVTDVVVVLPTPDQFMEWMLPFLQLRFALFWWRFRARARRASLPSSLADPLQLRFGACFMLPVIALLLWSFVDVLRKEGRKEGKLVSGWLFVGWCSSSLSSSFCLLKRVSVWRVDNSFPSSLEELYKIWKSWELLWDENQERRRRRKKKNRRRKSYDLCSCIYTCRRVVGRDGRGPVLFCCCGVLHSLDAAGFL